MDFAGRSTEEEVQAEPETHGEVEEQGIQSQPAKFSAGTPKSEACEERTEDSQAGNHKEQS